MIVYKPPIHSLHIASSYTDRFLSYFPGSLQCSKAVIKYPTSPQSCHKTVVPPMYSSIQYKPVLVHTLPGVVYRIVCDWCTIRHPGEVGAEGVQLLFIAVLSCYVHDAATSQVSLLHPQPRTSLLYLLSHRNRHFRSAAGVR